MKQTGSLYSRSRKPAGLAAFLRRWSRYVISVLIVAAVTLACFPIHTYIVPANLVMFYLAAVVFTAFYLGRGPSMLASLLSVLAFDFFFISPHLSFSVHDSQYLLTFFGLLIVGLVISNLAALFKGQFEASKRREAYTAALYTLSRNLAEASDRQEVFQAILDHLSENFGCPAAILLEQDKRLSLAAARPDFPVKEQELIVAARQPVAATDNPLYCIPFRASSEVIGVLAIWSGELDQPLTSEQQGLLEAYASLASLAIERVHLNEQASQARELKAIEKLQSALLDSISHELRTPLVAISGTLENLLDAEQEGSSLHLDREVRLNMLDNAREAASYLNHLVGNLLDMSRLEANALRLAPEPYEVSEVIGAALVKLRERLKGRVVKTILPSDLPLLPVDIVLIEQVLINLLENAIKYSPTRSTIVIRAEQKEDRIHISVIDRGLGIPPEDLTRIFNKFYRIRRPEGVSGTGLGLSICKGIIEAHGGSIWAENNPEGGSAITFALPVEPVSKEGEKI